MLAIDERLSSISGSIGDHSVHKCNIIEFRDICIFFSCGIAIVLGHRPNEILHQFVRYQRVAQVNLCDIGLS